MKTQTNGRNPGRQAYRLPIERRAVVAAGMVREHNWSQRQAAGLCCVNPAYVSVAQRLSDDDRVKLARGELKLSRLWKNHLRELAEQRAQERAELIERAEREEQARDIQACIDRVGLARLIEQIVARFGYELPLHELDVLSHRTNRDFAEIVIEALGADRVLRVVDKLTSPQLSLVAA
jgi:hypothetical protein